MRAFLRKNAAAFILGVTFTALFGIAIYVIFQPSPGIKPPATVTQSSPATLDISFEDCTTKQESGVTATRYDNICMVSVDRITYASVKIDADWCDKINLTSPLNGERRWVFEAKGNLRLTLVSQDELARKGLAFYNPSPSITLDGHVLTDMGRAEKRSCTAGAPESTD